jgi:hypothetical protein
MMATMDASPQAWAWELAEYAKADRISQLPKDPIVVVGGRRVKLWNDLEDLLSPSPVLVRSLGDAIVEDITYNYEALIGYYRPQAVVLLPGNSEFYIRDNKSAQDLVAAIQDLADLDETHNGSDHFYIFSPLKTPLYPRNDRTVDETTLLLQAWATTNQRVTVLDGNALLSDKNGKPKAGFYRSDGVNLNERGYLRLGMLLRTQIEADAGQSNPSATSP